MVKKYTKTKYGTSNAKMTNIGIKPKNTKSKKTGPIALPGTPNKSKFNPNPKMKKAPRGLKTGPISLGDGPLFLPSDFNSPLATAPTSVVKSSMMGRGAKPPRLNIANSNFEGVAKSSKGLVGKVGKKIGKGIKKGFKGNAFGLAAGAIGAIDALATDQPLDKKIGGVIEAGLTAYNPLFAPLFAIGRPVYDDIVTNVGRLFGGESRAAAKRRGKVDQYKANFFENYSQEADNSQNKQLEEILKKYGYNVQ